MKAFDSFFDRCSRFEWHDVRPWAYAAVGVVVLVLTQWILSAKSPGTGIPGALPGLSLP
jgi:hypothetical protein